MKKVTLLFLTFTFSIAVMGQTNNYQNGDIVNDFTVTDTEGVVHNLYDITASGKYVFLDFFFDTCGPCQNTQPIYNKLHDKYGCNEGEIFVISINNGTDNNAEVIAFENMYGGPFNHSPAVSNEGNSTAVNNDFGVSAFPTYCLISPDNEMVNRDIWPIANVGTYEAAFPVGFEPEPMSCTILAVNDNEHLSFSIYPNPSNGTNINLQLNSSSSNTEVKIYSMLGILVHTSVMITTETLIVANLSAGTYLVTVSNDEGMATSKLIVR
jgi:thiol-disulfide isomerase/thioredoxin